MTNILDYPGSRWWKFDFRTHTTQSNDYDRGDQSLKDIQPEEWLQKAMESGIDCVVVTDHNSGGWFDLLKIKNKELRDSSLKPDWYSELTIFPCAEMTVANSSHCVHLLAVFDPGCDSQTVAGVLGSCGITSTTTGFIQTVKKIIDADGIALVDNIDGEQWILAAINSSVSQFEISLKAVSVAEFCDVHPCDSAESFLRRTVKRVARVAGSDAYKPEDIGKHFSWLKMSRPSIAGLRQSLLDHEFCLKNQYENPNQLPDIFLSKLTIQSMRHCGRIDGSPFVSQFHPHFNAVIGGRGTGKSTIVESIRIVARRDQNLAIEAPRVKDELDKFMKLSQNVSQNKGIMLNNTEILLEVHRRSHNFRLRWRFDGQGAVVERKRFLAFGKKSKPVI